MDSDKFGRFVAERRKELNMTQKDLAAKIQVTDKAVSKWERGLGFPDINSIEDLANALELSIVELMRSEKELKETAVNEVGETVNDVVRVATADLDERHKIILYTFTATTVIFSILDILLSIEWQAEKLMISATIPHTATVPGIILIIYGIICKVRGKNTYGAGTIGICLLIIPIIVLGLSLLINALITG